MHIIIGVLTALAGLVWALYRLQNSGVDLNAFNPFYWARRRKWAKELGTKPLHRIQQPMEAAAVLVVATAKLHGDITRELKALVLQLFMEEFNIDQREAIAHYSASVHLLDGVVNLQAEVKNILAPTQEQFKPIQIQSLLTMLNKVAAEDDASEEQMALIESVEACLTKSRPHIWKASE